MAENTELKQRRGKGKPFQPGQSGNPAGKPMGAKNKATRLAQSLLDGEEEALVRKVIELAKGGDLQALKVCLDRLIPPMKAQSALIHVEIPKTANLIDTADALLRAAAGGELSPDIASQLISAVGTIARVTEIEDLKQRLSALEAAIAKNKGA